MLPALALGHEVTPFGAFTEDYPTRLSRLLDFISNPLNVIF